MWNISLYVERDDFPKVKSLCEIWEHCSNDDEVPTDINKTLNLNVFGNN